MKALLFAEPSGSAVIQDVLRSRGHEVQAFADEAKAWEAYQDGAPALVFLDPSMRAHEAQGLCRRIRCFPQGRRSLVLAGVRDEAAAGLEAFWEAGADGIFVFSEDRDKTAARLAVVERQAVSLVKRLDAETALRARIELEELIANLSSAFINIDPDEVDRGIQRALKTIGEFARADRSYVFQLSADGSEMSNTHEWCAPGVQPEIHNLQGLSVEAYPWWMQRMRRLEVVQVPRVRDLPPEARAERDSMEAQGIQALVVVPMALGRTLKGFVGFDLVRAEGLWTEPDIHLLKTVGDILANALERKRTEEALLKSEERFRRLVENAADAFFVCDLDGRILDVNQRACESLGYTRGELLRLRLPEIEREPVLEGVLAGWREGMRALPMTVETVQRRKDATFFPAEARLGGFEEDGRPLALMLVRDITQRKRHEDSLETLNRTFLSLGGDIDKNVQSLTEACGGLLGASCAVYRRLQDGQARVAGSYNLPKDYVPGVPAEGHLCYDVLQRTAHGVLLIDDLPNSSYARTDPHVNAYGPKVYAGHPVFRHGKTVGSLCIVYFNHAVFGKDQERLLEIFAAALGTEEERRLAQENLRSSEERFRQVTESIREVFYLANAERPEMIYISPAYEEIWGRSTRSLYEAPRSWMDAVHPDDRSRVFDALMAKPQGMHGFDDEEYRIVRPDGSIRWIRDRSFPIRNGEGRIYRVAGIAEDITDRKRMEREVVEISGREQRRIGQDLHDGLGQSLTGIAFLSKAVQERLAQKGLSEAGDMEKVVRLVNDAIAHTKGLGRGLYPVELETNGLAAALQELASQTETVFKVPCAVQVDAAAVDSLGADAEVNLYRIAQEALTNAVKHGKPKRIDVRLSVQDGKTTLAVSDDGVGVGDAPPAEGMGLRIMNYRAKVIGASLALRRSSDGGTVVACTVARRS